MANFGPLTVEIGSGVWGTTANFNRFRVLPSLLQRRRSTEANQTLKDVWPSLPRPSAKICGVVQGTKLYGSFADGTTYIRLFNTPYGVCSREARV